MLHFNTSIFKNKWRMFVLFSFVMTLRLALIVCFDPCPESVRGSKTTELPEIPDEEIEKAFHLAEERVKKRNELELKLIGEGRTIPRNAVTAESNHQPISSTTPIIRENEVKQLVFEEASRILTKKYHLSAAQVSCGLPKLPLSTPTAKRALEICTADDTAIQCDSQAKYRTLNGTCNNLKNPTWGSAVDCVDRLFLPKYTGYSDFRRSVQGRNLPRPRQLSLNVHGNLNKSALIVNHLFVFFGQLLAHDLTATSPSSTMGAQTIQCCPQIRNNHPQCAPITLKTDDPFYAQFQKTCFNFVRSASCRYCTLGPRCQVDSITPFIDVSFVYGNDFYDLNLTRNHDGTGTLFMQSTVAGELLPLSSDPSSDRCSYPQKHEICFQSGDARVNQHPMLTSLHTLFHREHNRIARNLSALNPDWDEETVFQEARKVVGAVMQVVVYKEYLPLTVGKQYMSSHNLWIGKQGTTYNPNLNPSLFTEVSTAFLRFGHAMVNSLVKEDPSKPGHSSHFLKDTYIYPFGLYKGEMDPLLKGSTESTANDFNRHMITDLTDFLYRIRGTPAGLDLASINIQRGRDHGLQPYVIYVQRFSKEKIRIRSFDDLRKNGLMTSEIISVLRRHYKRVQDIDLFTGVVSETSLTDAIVGPTAASILALQFEKLKLGDRFYFEHTGQPGSFTNEQIRELKKVSLAKVICDNTEITEIQQQAMAFPTAQNAILSCSEISGMNLEVWKNQS